MRFSSQGRLCFRRLLLVLLIAIFSFSATRSSIAQARTVQRRPGKILIIRGIFTVFSLGLDKLGNKLRSMGYNVEVTDPTISYAGLQRIRDEYRCNPQLGPIVIIGHSIGGRLCLHYSRALQSEKIPVKLVIIADANPHVPVPGNVERCVNLYVTNSFGVFHGRPVQRESVHTQLVNQDMTKIRRPRGSGGVNHFNIDASDWIHRIICTEVAQATVPGVRMSGRKRPSQPIRASVAKRNTAPQHRQPNANGTSHEKMPGNTDRSRTGQSPFHVQDPFTGEMVWVGPKAMTD